MMMLEPAIGVKRLTAKGTISLSVSAKSIESESSISQYSPLYWAQRAQKYRKRFKLSSSIFLFSSSFDFRPWTMRDLSPLFAVAAKKDLLHSCCIVVVSVSSIAFVPSSWANKIVFSPWRVVLADNCITAAYSPFRHVPVETLQIGTSSNQGEGQKSVEPKSHSRKLCPLNRNRLGRAECKECGSQRMRRAIGRTEWREKGRKVKGANSIDSLPRKW